LNGNTKNFFAASLLGFFNHDVHDDHDEWLPPQHDAKRRFLSAKRIKRRGRRVRRGEIKLEQRSCELNITS